jgi:hypothetical protein
MKAGPITATKLKSGEAVGKMLLSFVSALMLHCCHTVVTLLLYCCYNVITLLLHGGYNVVTLLLLHCLEVMERQRGRCY